MRDKFFKYGVFVLVLIYIVSPWDLIPDALGLLGRVDELVLIIYLLRYYYFLKPRQSVDYGEQSPPAPEGKQNLDPYQILGLDRKASQEQIAAAYKKEAAKYHPDKVNHLGEDLQKLAHEKMLAIGRAYQQLKENH